MQKIEILKSKELIDYPYSIKIMENRVRAISEGKKDELIWFLNHNEIYTQGASASKDEIIKKSIIPILKTNRGGKTTYHGPGQRIVYFMINLNNRKKDIRKFITIIENSTINFLKIYDIEATTFRDRIGIWVTKFKKKSLKKEEKIGAIGLRVKKWITYHGLSFNINTNLNNYNNIHACGLQNFKNTSLEKLGINIDYHQFDIEFKNIFLKELKKLD